MRDYNQDEDWTQQVVYNLRRIFERMDEREQEKLKIRKDLKDFLEGIDPPEEGGFEYGRVLDLVEAFFMAVKTPMFKLADAVVYRIIIARDALKSGTMPADRKVRIKNKLIKWIKLAVYELQKIQVPAVEEREFRMQDSALGILGRDVLRLYDRNAGSDVNDQIDQEKREQDYYNDKPDGDGKSKKKIF